MTHLWFVNFFSFTETLTYFIETAEGYAESVLYKYPQTLPRTACTPWMTCASLVCSMHLACRIMCLSEYYHITNYLLFSTRLTMSSQFLHIQLGHAQHSSWIINVNLIFRYFAIFTLRMAQVRSGLFDFSTQL